MFLGTSIRLNSVPLSEKIDSGFEKSAQNLSKARLTSISSFELISSRKGNSEKMSKNVR